MNPNVSLLLRRVWRIDNASSDRQWLKRSLPYQQHYHDVRACSFIENLQAEQLAEIVGLIRQHYATDIQIIDIVSHIQAQRLPWLHNTNAERTLVHLLNLVLKLWLFTTTDIRTCRGSLSEAVSSQINESFKTQTVHDLTHLSDDFSAKNLEKRGGFTIYWTSELSEHLSCVDGKVLKVFRHGSVLQTYLDRADGIERSLYPSGLLSEIDATFSLLFPFHGVKASKRMWKESKKRRTDLIEPSWADDAIEEFGRLQLKSYPRYGSRLAEIQRRYDAAKPVRPKQWWYDRRRRLEWAALMIAVLVLILTIITVVTSVLQVYVAIEYRQ